MGWIERSDAVLPLPRQCKLAGVPRVSVYRWTIEREQSEEDLLLCRLIDEEYTRRPFYGSRRVLSWRISNSMDASFCVDCLEEVLRVHGKSEIFNSDQGSQFTSHAFTGVLKREQIAISMDGRGRALDNIFVERL